MDNLNVLSILIISVFVAFIFIITLRTTAPKILVDTRKSISDNFLLSLIIIISIGLMTYSMDEENGLHGIIGMLAVIALFSVLSHPSTFNDIESFENNDDQKNAKLRTMESLDELMKCADNTEKGLTSLPVSTQKKNIQAGVLKIKKDIQSLIQQVNEGFQSKDSKATPAQARDQAKWDSECNKLDKNTKDKIDTIVQTINQEMDKSDSQKDFCDNKMICSFIRYMLVENPGAFFDKIGGETKETFEDGGMSKEQEKQLEEAQKLSTYKDRALALFKILEKRKQFRCTMSLTVCCLETVKDEFIPVSDIDFKDRKFSMTATEAQDFFTNPGKITKELDLAFKMPEKEGETMDIGAQKKIIIKMMQVMHFLYLGQSKPNECTNIYVDV